MLRWKLAPLVVPVSLSLSFALACSDDGPSEADEAADTAGTAGTDDDVGATGTAEGNEQGSDGMESSTGMETTADTGESSSSSTGTETTADTGESSSSSTGMDTTSDTGDSGGSSTGAMDTDTGVLDTDTGAMDTDTGGTDTGNNEAPWLLHVRNDTDQLVKIDTDTGVETVICDFVGDANYPSITFGISGELFGSRGGQNLDLIDPCTCETSYIGNMGFTGVNGITANGLEILRLYGISVNSDVLLDIDTMTALATVVGNGLGINIGYSGSTWSNDIVGLYAINADDDMLYDVDIITGLATGVVDLDVDFVTVGIEWHPVNGVLYGCTNDHLYSIDPDTGVTMEIGNMNHSCNNLAAPWTAVACIDDL